MFHDPALVLACDLPVGWCLDAESSLFRLVFRPWDRIDERVIVTVLPTAVAPTASDDAWAEAVKAGLSLGDAAEALVLGAGVALTASLVTADGRKYRRV